MDSNRGKKLIIGAVVSAALLLVRLFFIQIVDDKYKKSAMNNSVMYETVYPPRGRVFDRDGNVLVGNKTIYDIMVTPREIEAFDTLGLALTLEMDPDEIREKLDYYRRYRSRIGYNSLVFKKNVDPELYLKMVETQYKFPGFFGQVRSVRDYPFNAGGNLLGYVSEVDGDYIRKHPGYRAGDYYGATGIEAMREADLRGEKGYNIYLRDSRNRILTAYNNGLDDKPAVPGKDVVTTIDAHLQQYGQELMQNKRGSIVAIEPSTGEILAMVSSPGIDVEALANMGKYYSEFSSNPHKPLFNRSLQASYPPGSVFKIVSGLIGLQEGLITPSTRFPCDNGFQYSSTKKLGCHKHRSPINFKDAIMMSCNGYFCNVFKTVLENPRYGSTKAAYENWEEYVRSFGLGSRLGIDFPNEVNGNVPKSSRYDKIYGAGHWRYSSVISLSIGQGELGVTPLQMANLCATIANRGWYYTPHIVKDSKDIAIDTMYHEKHVVPINSAHFEACIDGMYKAVNCKPEEGGTARLGAIKDIDLCGKTGTAENPHGADHSVFICFAPREDPKIAVAVYIENAGFGGTWACPTASLVVERYLNGEIDESRQWLEDYVKSANLLNVKKNDKRQQ